VEFQRGLWISSAFTDLASHQTQGRVWRGGGRCPLKQSLYKFLNHGFAKVTVYTYIHNAYSLGTPIVRLRKKYEGKMFFLLESLNAWEVNFKGMAHLHPTSSLPSAQPNL